VTPTRLSPEPDFVLPQMIRRRAEQTPDANLVEPVGGAPITAAQFHLSTVRIAGALARSQIKQGECVASMLEASPLAIGVWIGAAWIRAYEVPVNPDSRGAVLLHTLNDCRARVLVTQGRFLDHVQAIAAGLEHLVLVVVVDGGPTRRDRLSPRITVIPFDDFSAGEDLREFDGPRESDAYAVSYTSGTTGPSKGVVRGWAGLHASLTTVFPGDEHERYDDPAVYSPWAMFHSSGKISALAAVQMGGRLVQRGRFSLTEFWRDISESRCTHTMLFSVGAKLWQARSPEWRDNPLRRAFANPLFPEFADFSEFFRVRVTTAWGMTEIGLPLVAPDPADWRTCGRVVPGYEIRLVDEFDQEVADHEVGQLVARHDRPWHIATRYFGNPEATEAAWQNGWFHTGDLLRRDTEGNFYFVDRMNDYVRHRGHNVSSLEVEQEVLAHPGVLECACVGVRTVQTGPADRTPAVLTDEEIKLFVVRRAGVDVDGADLCGFLEDRVPKQMLPRYIEFVDELPRTPTMKVRKVELRERAHSPRTWDRLGSALDSEGVLKP
jgi:crotonobetaine/carnitine-CoA ligase